MKGIKPAPLCNFLVSCSPDLPSQEVTGRGKNREYRRLVQKIIFFSIKAKRKVESLSAQFKKAQEKYNRYKGLF